MSNTSSFCMMQLAGKETIFNNYQIKLNKRNDKRFNNHACSFFFLIAIFLKHLWLVPNILEWQDCKIFTKLVLLRIPSRNSDRRCSVEKGVIKNFRNFKGQHLCWCLFLIKLQNSILKKHLRKTAFALTRIYKT